MNMNAVHQSTRPHRRRLHKRAVRVLTAVPLCDGHDSAIMTINLELVRHGIEVIYLGYHRSVADIVRAAMPALDRDYSPLTDMRASAAYRRKVSKNLLYKLFLETSGQPAKTNVFEFTR